MSLCFFVSYLLRVHVHAHQLRHAATPHCTGLGDVHQLGRVFVSQLSGVRFSVGKRVRSAQHTAAIQVQLGGGWLVPLRCFDFRQVRVRWGMGPRRLQKSRERTQH
jgi:hypothetical protein